MQAALVDVQKHFNNTGIVISDMQWLGNIRAPDSVVNAIQQRTQVEQQTQVAIQRQKQAEAEGAANIAKAEADAKVKQLEASALNSAGGEKSIQMAWIAKWKGDVPTYVTGNSPMTMMMPVAGK
jgi:regulator of protease activity HflC (stomatin/prohibitin superfamily)